MKNMRNQGVTMATAVAAFATTLTISPVVMSSSEFRTEYERSDGARVGGPDQAERLKETLEESKLTRGEILGQTSEGRPIIAFEVGPRDKPSVLLFGGIHAGEVEGSIALLHLVRDIAAGQSVADAHAWIVPYLSPDGAADIGFLHRPNQLGPKEAGFRVNGSGLNLNRDFLKAESPEIRALLKLVSLSHPVLAADFHTTDGGVFKIDVGLRVPHSIWPGTDKTRSLDRTRDALLKDLISQLQKKNVTAEDYYPVLMDDTRPRKGLVNSSSHMRFSDGYFAASARLGVLVEINAYASLNERVRIARETALALLGEAHIHGDDWATAIRAAQEEAMENVPGTKDVELDWEQGPEIEKRDVTFLGLNYRKSPVTDEMETVYEGTAPVRVTLPRFGMKASRWADAPAKDGGYVIAGGFVPVVKPILDAHKLKYEVLRDEVSFVKPQWFLVEKAEWKTPNWPPTLFDEPSLEGHARVTVSGSWTTNPSIDFLGRFRMGSIFIPISQPGALIAIALFEPTGPDSIVAWGLLNIWERHEYPERHRAVLLSEQALVKEPALAEELIGTKDGVERLSRILQKKHPELFRRIGWVPVLKVAGK